MKTDVPVPVSSTKIDALLAVLGERQRQDQKWGVQNHDPLTYLAILMEEVGEATQAALQLRFGGDKGSVDHLREELVQTAAVALACVECLDRNEWAFPTVAQPQTTASTPGGRPTHVLKRTDHGVDGWDAKTAVAAYFTSRDNAMAYLRGIGYDYPQYGSFYANKVEHRNTMGAISYSVVELTGPIDPPTPIDPVVATPRSNA